MILVTGANGFIGKRLVERLCAAGLSVTATGRRPHAGPALPAGCAYVEADLSDPADVAELAAHGPYGTILHLAATAVFKDTPETDREMYRSNVTATFNLVELARDQKSRFVFLSSGMVYGDQRGPFKESMATRPGNFYAVSKLMGEEMIRFASQRHGFAHLIFRIAIVYGPGQPEGMFIPSLVQALSAGKDFPMTEGNQIRDFLYIEDCLRAIHLGATGEAQGTFNLATGLRTTMREVGETAAAIAGAKEALKPGALPYRQNELWEYYMEIAAITSALGWRPEVGLKQGLERMVQHALSNRK
ncbi:MAG: epimerase [Fibrobacteres bacterium]|nr:epimerase [Fibrobacterota bacterium]